MSELPPEDAARDLSGAVDYLLGDGSVTSSKVGVIGFCMGGAFALALAGQQGDRIGAAVAFYGVGSIPSDFSGITAPVQGHYGERDEFYPVDQAHAQEQQMNQQTQNSVEFHYYDAGHAFHNDKDQLGTYDADLAKLAWSRTVDFLRTNLA
jgi:carboxymethylenebutenolidase